MSKKFEYFFFENFKPQPNYLEEVELRSKMNSLCCIHNSYATAMAKRAWNSLHGSDQLTLSIHEEEKVDLRGSLKSNHIENFGESKTLFQNYNFVQKINFG